MDHQHTIIVQQNKILQGECAVMENVVHDYSIKKKYCPALRQNVVFKVENNAEHKEYCMNSQYCQVNDNCEWNGKQTQLRQ